MTGQKKGIAPSGLLARYVSFVRILASSIKIAFVAVFTLSLLATFWVWNTVREDNYNSAYTYFYHETKRLENAVFRRMKDHEFILRTGVSFLKSSDTGTRHEWKNFIDNLDLDNYHPGILGVGFSLRLTPGQLPSHIRTIRQQGFPGYRVWPEGKREEYTSIIYLEPFEGRNLRAFGYDMFTEPVRHAAMVRARDEGHAALSGRVRLVQETNEDVQSGFLIYVPLYRQDLPLDTVEERRKALRGYVYSPYRIKDLMEGILLEEPSEDPRDFEILIFDGESLSEKNLMYDSNPKGSNLSALNLSSPEEARENFHFHRTSTMHVGGHNWTLHFRTLPSFRNHVETRDSLIVLISGFLITFLLSSITYTLSTNRDRALALADEMTRAYRQSEEKWQYALEGSGDGIWEWNLKEKKIFFSRRWGEILGMEENEIYESLRDWIQRIYPEDRAQVRQESRNYFKNKYDTFSVECRILSREGGYRWMLIRGKNVTRDHRQGPVRMVGTFTDITERKENVRRMERIVEEETRRRVYSDFLFKTIFDSSPIGISLLSPEGEVLQMSPSMVRILGQRDTHLAMVEMERELTGGLLGGGGRIPRQVEEIVKGEKTLFREERSIRRRDGRAVDINITLSPIRNSEGESSFALILVEDISERKELEKKQKEQEQLLIQQSKMAAMGEMIGAIAHQWRQPLNTLAILIQDISDAAEFEELTKEYLDRTVQESMDQIEYMSRTIDDFRNFFRSRRAREPFSLQQAIQDVMKLISAQMDYNKIVIKQLYPRRECVVEGIANEFKQVILNILNNARDAILDYREKSDQDATQYEGGISISLQCSDHKTIIAIHDNGGGVPDDLIYRIFEPYFTTRESGKGTGIGLYMARVIVEENMEGRLSVRNRDSGAEFVIEI